MMLLNVNPNQSFNQDNAITVYQEISITSLAAKIFIDDIVNQDIPINTKNDNAIISNAPKNICIVSPFKKSFYTI